MAPARPMAGSRAHRDRGAAAVEFALVVPLLFMLVFGIVDFSRAYNARVSLTEAAAEGARALAIGRTDAQATTSVRDALEGSTVSQGDVRVIITKHCTASSSGDTGAMQVVWNFQLLTPVPAPSRSFDLQGVGVRQCAT